MSPKYLRCMAALSVLALCWPATSAAAGVSVQDDALARPFPNDRYTVPDFGNLTFKRVNLPLPDCSVQISDCADLAHINQLDGFSTQPRITLPFTGEIDVSTVDSSSVYLLNLGDTQTLQGLGQKVGINQVVWDPETLTLAFEPDELLADHTRYLVVVTGGVRDMDGRPIRKKRTAPWLARAKRQGWKAPVPRASEHDMDLKAAMRALPARGKRVVSATLFTTQSSTVDLVKIMRQIKRSTPTPASFDLGRVGGAAAPSVFPVADLVQASFQRQTQVAGPLTTTSLPLGALQVVPGAVGKLAYGRFQSTQYLNAQRFMPSVPSWTGTPEPTGGEELVFQVFLPAGQAPQGGWPVALFGHGFTDSMYGAPWVVASVLASRGIATASLNVVGHAGGSDGYLELTRLDGQTVKVPAGGRGMDQNGDGVIDSTEGVAAVFPNDVLGNRDGLRQTTVDLMQLVRQIEQGLDVDGDGATDLSQQRIYYAGQSFGGIYGTMLLGLEPSLRAGVANVPGGSLSNVARLGVFRALVAGGLAVRQPSLINLPPTPGLPVPYNLNFDENVPLRDQPPVTNDVPGAMAIAKVLDRQEWAQQPGNPVSYASLIRRHPLRGSVAKPVIYQFAKGDQTVPNPTTTAILRAGDLAPQATYFRNDLAFAADSGVPKNPHTFLTNISSASGAPYAVMAQQQMAVFFQSDGQLVVDPDGPAPMFEVPAVLPLPEELNFLP
ncbi:Ig-like domain-containing protein [Hydrogenophaga sp. 5NK40-0174]|uniref:Ig-like domain-containing protein n=1 Tax=Hydrogenophaga sp. 5NK40-0174 TaxID=3127649 RepID=UPI003103A4E7